MRLRNTIIGGLLGAGLSWLMLTKQFGTWGYQPKEYYALAFGAAIFLPFSWWFSPFIQTRSSKRLISGYGSIMSILFVCIWLIPINCTGNLKANLYTIPAPIRNQYRISCLFTYASRSWATIHYEVRKNGHLEWEEGPLEGFFDLDIFGYRTKLNRIGLASRYKDKKGNVYGKNKLRLQEMANFIATRWAENYPEDPEIKEVRFFRVSHKVGGKHCMKKEIWSRPALSSIPEGKRELLISVPIGEKEKKERKTIKLPPRIDIKKDQMIPVPKGGK